MTAVENKLITVEDLKVGFDYNKNHIGDLSKLKTTAKSDIVSAINELGDFKTNTYSETSEVPVTGTAVADAISGLSATSVGESGKYISSIKEENGKIVAVLGTITDEYTPDGDLPVNGCAITKAIGTLDFDDTPVTDEYVSAVQEVDGIISPERGLLHADNVLYDNTASELTSTNAQGAIDELKNTHKGAAHLYRKTFWTNDITINAGSNRSGITFNGYADFVASGYYPLGILSFVPCASASAGVDYTYYTSLDSYYVKNNNLIVAISNRRTDKAITVQIAVSVIFVKSQYVGVKDY